MHIAGLLSRDYDNEDSLQENNYQILFYIPTTAAGLKILQDLSNTDPELILLKHSVSTGWPRNKDLIPDSCKKYLPYVDELSIKKDLVFKCLNIIITEKYRAKETKEP